MSGEAKLKVQLPGGEMVEGELVTMEQMRADQEARSKEQFEREQGLVKHARELLDKNRVRFVQNLDKESRGLPDDQVACLKAALAEVSALGNRIATMEADLVRARDRLTALVGQSDGLVMILLLAKEKLEKAAEPPKE